MSYDVTKTIENLNSFNAVAIGYDACGAEVVYDYRQDIIQEYDEEEGFWVEVLPNEIKKDPEFYEYVDLDKIPLIKKEWEKQRRNS